MPISTRFVVKSTIVLLTVGLLTLLGIVGMTIWLGERAQVYFNEAIEARDTRGAAVELRSALQSAESSQRGFLVSGNEIYLAPYDTAKSLDAAAARGACSSCSRLKSGRRRAAAAVRPVIDEKFAEMDQTIALKADRRDAEALAMFRTNRGKALMDEANVFLSGIIRAADERLTDGVAEQQRQRRHAALVSIVGGLVIVLVVGGVIVTLLRYTREIAQARDEVRVLNTSLESG